MAVSGHAHERRGDRGRRQGDVAVDRAQRVLAATHTGVWVRDVATGATRWSDEVGPLHGLPASAQPASHEEYLRRAIHPDDRAALEEHLVRALEIDQDFTLEYRVALPDGVTRWVGVRAHVVRSTGRPVELIGLTYDVTERRRREEASALLAQASSALAQSLDPFRTLHEIARLAVPGRADWCSVHLLREDGHLDAVAVAHIDPQQRRIARALASRFPPDPGATVGVAEVIRSGRSELHAPLDQRRLEEWARDADQRALLAQLRPCSMMIVPLIAHGPPLGTISFTYTGSGRCHDAEDLALGEELGRRAGLALENARQYERRQRAAATLQRALLPRSVPQPPGYEVAPAYVPATEGDEAGGDWYDAFMLPEGRLGLVIGDVVGKGVEAAATMGQLRNALRAYALVEPDPGGVIDLLDQMARKLGDVSFATVSYATLDLDSGRIAYASAGHLPPLSVGADGSARFLGGAMVPPLATLHPVPCRANADVVAPGDTLLLYTDGLVETRERDLDAGLSALAELARTPLPLTALVTRLLAGMDAGSSRDDVAILAVRREA